MNKLKNIDILKLSIALSLLIVALSIGYYLVIFLPSQQSIKRGQIYNQSGVVKTEPTNTPLPTPTTQTTQKPSTLNLLNQCLDAAKAERDRVNGELLKLADEGQTVTKSAFDSNGELYKQEREDCFAKYPQR